MLKKSQINKRRCFAEFALTKNKILHLVQNDICEGFSMTIHQIGICHSELCEESYQFSFLRLFFYNL